MSQKLIVVLGASGTQGSSVVTALLKHGGYDVRGITRNPNTPWAEALKDKGVEVVSANLVEKDSLIKAFDGAYAVFGVTIPFTEDSEEVQGRNIVDAAKIAKVSLLVWSSLPSARETSNGKFTTIRCGAFGTGLTQNPDNHVDISTRRAPLTSTSRQPASPLSSCILACSPRTSMQYDSRASGVWIEGDLGNIVVAIINHWEVEAWRERLMSEPVVAAPYDITGVEMAQILSERASQRALRSPVVDTLNYSARRGGRLRAADGCTRV